MASDAKACFSSKVEYRAVIRYLYLKGKTGKEIHGELADVYGFSAPSYAQVKFWVRWSGGAKVSCMLCHRGVQLILAYSWARPAILVAGKGR